MEFSDARYSLVILLTSIESEYLTTSILDYATCNKVANSGPRVIAVSRQNAMRTLSLGVLFKVL